MKNKIEVDLEMMMFTNNVLRAKANGNPPTAYLTNQQQEWWKTVQECQDSVKIYVNDKYESLIHIEQFANLGYPQKPGYPQNGFEEFFSKSGRQPDKIISKAELDELNKQGVFAPNAKEAEKDRCYTKYRIIVSDVPVLNEDGTISKIKVISACAPNLMGSSPRDKEQFIDTQGQLKKKEYQEACSEIANLMAFAAKDNNIDPVKIAEFGLGVYLKELSPTEKEEARKIMYLAFREAAEKHQVKFDWLIWNDPRKSKSAISSSVDNLNNGSFKGSQYISASAGDLLADIPQWTKTHPNVAEVNNGSDRTIGGAFTHYKPTTTEEQLTQASFIAFIQTTMNPQLTNDIKVVNTDTAQLVKQKGIQPQQTPQTSHQIMHFIMGGPSPTSLNKSATSLEEDQKMLHQVFGLETKQVSQVKEKNGSTSIKVVFNDPIQAQAFSEKLALQWITSNTNPGHLKRVINNAVYLTTHDLNQLHAQQQDPTIALKKTAVSYLNVKDDAITASVDKKSKQTNILMSFANKEQAELMSQQLFNLGVGSTTNTGIPKSVLDGNKIVLTAKDTGIVNQQYSELKHEIAFLRSQVTDFSTIVPSIDNRSGKTNLLVVFDTTEAAKKFIADLAKRDIGSLTRPGQPKSVLPGNGVILTIADCEKLEAKMSQEAQMKFS